MPTVSAYLTGPDHADAAPATIEASPDTPARASWLIAAVLVGEYWYQALPLLGKIAPEAIDAILDRLRRSVHAPT
jgi:hypothetical protein